jgi:hypothetical protein
MARVLLVPSENSTTITAVFPPPWAWLDPEVAANTINRAAIATAPKVIVSPTLDLFMRLLSSSVCCVC